MNESMTDISLQINSKGIKEKLPYCLWIPGGNMGAINLHTLILISNTPISCLEEQTNEEDYILFSVLFLEKLLDVMKSYLIALLISKRQMPPGC